MKEFDDIEFLFESCSDDKAFNEIIEEYGETSYGKENILPMNYIG